MSKPFKTTIENGIAEMILDHPPVNAFDSAGWFAIANEIDALGRSEQHASCAHGDNGTRARWFDRRIWEHFGDGICADATS